MNERVLTTLAFPTLLTLAACASNLKPIDTVSTAPEVVSAKELFDGSKAILANEDNTRETTNGLRQNPFHSANKSKPERRSAFSTPAAFQGLSYWIERLGNSGVSRATTSTVFRNNDRILLHVRSNCPGYLYIVNQGSSGRPNLLFPTAGSSEYIEPGRTYTIPSTGHIRFVEPPGQETVWLFLSAQPLPVNPAQGSLKQGSGYATQNVVYNPCGAKDLVAEAPAALQDKCGLGSKDLMVEDDTQSTMPAEYAVAPTTLMEQGKILSLRVGLRHE